MRRFRLWLARLLLPRGWSEQDFTFEMGFRTGYTKAMMEMRLCEQLLETSRQPHTCHPTAPDCPHDDGALAWWRKEPK